MFILWWIIVGLIAGWLTGKIMSGGGYGPVMDIVVGVIGALVGGFIMRSVGFAGAGWSHLLDLCGCHWSGYFNVAAPPCDTRTCSTSLTMPNVARIR